MQVSVTWIENSVHYGRIIINISKEGRTVLKPLVEQSLDCKETEIKITCGLIDEKTV